MVDTRDPIAQLTANIMLIYTNKSYFRDNNLCNTKTTTVSNGKNHSLFKCIIASVNYWSVEYMNMCSPWEI